MKKLLLIAPEDELSVDFSRLLSQEYHIFQGANE